MSPADATIHAYTVGFTAGAVIFAAGFLLALILLPSRRTTQDRTGAPRTNPARALSRTSRNVQNG